MQRVDVLLTCQAWLDKYALANHHHHRQCHQCLRRLEPSNQALQPSRNDYRDVDLSKYLTILWPGRVWLGFPWLLFVQHFWHCFGAEPCKRVRSSAAAAVASATTTINEYSIQTRLNTGRLLQAGQNQFASHAGTCWCICSTTTTSTTATLHVTSKQCVDFVRSPLWNCCATGMHTPACFVCKLNYAVIGGVLVQRVDTPPHSESALFTVSLWQVT